ncbi:MAG: hypothetical protein J4473_03605 [Candidatus Aenigmarchaeota archaeon]|nr:hypothetical protein [Candidatus Aenigmarchaeota archaeon]
MVSNEVRSVIIGASLVVIVTLLLNLSFGYRLELSAFIGIVIGIIAGLATNRL